MAGFSIGASIGDAFGLMTRRPLTVFVWGLLMLAPTFGSLALILPFMADIVSSATTGGTGAYSPFGEDAFAQMMRLQMASLLSNVVQLVVMAVIYTAIFRAVLRPRESAFFSLRLGMDELRVAVVGLVIGVALYAAAMFGVLACVALGFGVGGQDPGAGVLTGVLLGIVVLAGLFWMLARVSLMAPASVLYRDFAFGQGWTLARGKGWPLLGMMLLIVLLVIVIQSIGFMFLAVAFSGAFAAMTSGGGDGAETLEGLGAWMAAHWYLAALGALLFSMIYGVILTLGAAPFASAARQLAGGATPGGDETPA